MRPESREQKLERLAARVTAGEVVFFIGAGFSLESERNSTQVLIARLLARVEALSGYIATDPLFRDATLDIRKGLRTTFWLKETMIAPKDQFGTLFDVTQPAGAEGVATVPGANAPPKVPSILKSNMETLARNYYLINDWTCSSFEKLISLFAQRFATGPLPDGLATKVNEIENDLLAKFHSIDPFKNTRKLAPIDFRWLIDLYLDSAKAAGKSQRSVAGKALFLETLGFLDPEIMAGAPTNPSFQYAVESSSARLGQRHHVLAWLAAEGLCSTLVTTNYDFLLESAYRTAGLLPTNPPEDRWGKGFPLPLTAALDARLPVNCRYPCYTRVASAVDFFTHNKALQSVLIHKMHGCVDSYRIARERVDYAMARAVLPTIVFTFREIQNWRDDAWSRDYLSTLLRTRTVVFAGYSGADPVVHDTFRTVYEEMARQNARMSDAHVEVRGTPASSVAGANARAFFLDQETQREFYALEILRSAGLAEGDPSPNLSDHANLLTFFTANDKLFPNLDEILTWLFHLVARDLQESALVSELQRLAVQLFGRPCPESEARSVRDSFCALRKRERHAARVFDRGAREAWSDSVRRRFLNLTGWTSGFLVRLLREYELGIALLRNPGDSRRIQDISRFPWYRPITEHPEWAAWAAVMELAIRRVAAVSMRRPALWKRPGSHLGVAARATPTVLFRAGPFGPKEHHAPVRRCITIQLSTLRQLFREDRTPPELTALEPIIWKLRPGAIPWWPDDDPRRPQGTPSASLIWQWAALPPERWPAESHPDLVFGGQRQRDRAEAVAGTP